MLQHIEKRPDAMWRTGTIWSFRNEAKVYGSPMLDTVYNAATGGLQPSPVPELLAALRAAPVPFGGLKKAVSAAGMAGAPVSRLGDLPLPNGGLLLGLTATAMGV